MARVPGTQKQPQRERRLRLAFAVTTSIEAPTMTVWKLLTDIRAQSKWNSTLTSIEGEIAFGERVSFKVPEAPRRTFSPKVVAFDEPKSMVWRLNRWPLLVSERTYRLTPEAHGSTEITIAEVFQGLLLPLIAKSLPVRSNVRAHRHGFESRSRDTPRPPDPFTHASVRSRPAMGRRDSASFSGKETTGYSRAKEAHT